MSKATALVKNEDKVVVMPNTDADYEHLAGAGMENVKATDIIIPRVTILQGLSPQLNKQKAEYIKGAEAGQFVEVGINKILGEKFLFVPVYYSKRYLEWHPRASGKGLARIHDNDAIINETMEGPNGENVLPSGNIIMETAQFFGFDLSREMRQIFIPMASTQLKKARRWLSMANDMRLASGSKAPLFWGVYELSIVPESNNKGDFYGWKVDFNSLVKNLPNGKDILMEAHKFHHSLASGVAKADDSGIVTDATDDATVGSGKF